MAFDLGRARQAWVESDLFLAALFHYGLDSFPYSTLFRATAFSEHRYLSFFIERHCFAVYAREHLRPSPTKRQSL